MTANTVESTFDTGLKRRLPVFPVDSGLASRIETRSINEIVIDVPWEADEEQKGTLIPGRVGAYAEAVEYDPPSGVFHVAVNLHDPRPLASDGVGEEPQAKTDAVMQSDGTVSCTRIG